MWQQIISLDYMGINHLEELPVIDELEIQAQEKANYLVKG